MSIFKYKMLRKKYFLVIDNAITKLTAILTSPRLSQHFSSNFLFVGFFLFRFVFLVF